MHHCSLQEAGWRTSQVRKSTLSPTDFSQRGERAGQCFLPASARNEKNFFSFSSKRGKHVLYKEIDTELFPTSDQALYKQCLGVTTARKCGKEERVGCEPILCLSVCQIRRPRYRAPRKRSPVPGMLRREAKRIDRDTNVES